MLDLQWLNRGEFSNDQGLRGSDQFNMHHSDFARGLGRVSDDELP